MAPALTAVAAHAFLARVSDRTVRVVFDVAAFPGVGITDVVGACYAVVTALISGAWVARVVSLIADRGWVSTWI